MKSIQFSLLALCLVALVSCKTESTSVKSNNLDYSGVTVNTDSESEKFSYSLGMIIGNTLKNGGIDSIDYNIIDEAFEDSEENQYAYNVTAREIVDLVGEEIELDNIDQGIIKRAVYDVLQGDTTLLSVSEVGPAFQGYKASAKTAIAERNLKQGKDFLEENKNKEGVLTTDSGLQYQLVQQGSGETPKRGEVIKAWFKGESLSGKVFKEDTEDSFSIVDLEDGFAEIPALAEAVTLFPYGSEFILYIPSNLAFGENRISPELGPNSTLKVHVSKTEKADEETTKGFRDYKKALRQQVQQQQQQQQRR